MPKLSFFLAMLMLLSVSWNAFSWDRSAPNAPENSDMAMAVDMATAMDMSDHCDHEEGSSALKDCLNHCAMLIALVFESEQQALVIDHSFEFASVEAFPRSASSNHWRPPSQNS